MDIKDRLKQVIKSSPLSQTEIAVKLKITPQAVQQWCDGSTTPKGTRLVALADLLDVKLDWLQTGRGATYWVEQTGNFTAESSLNVTASSKLIEIINAADKAMNDSKCEFTTDERINYYLEALSFAGRKDFSSDFIRQYVKELLKQK